MARKSARPPVVPVQEQETSAIAPTTTVAPLPSTKQEAIAELRRHLGAMDPSKPHPEAVARVAAVLDLYPEVWRAVADLHETVRAHLIDAMTPPGSLIREAITRNATAMRDSMGYRDAPPLERGLIEHATIAWLRLQNTEDHYTRMLSQSIPVSQADWWERRLSAAQKRYLRAVETLARVRRLTRPAALQVNIGARQVNVVGDVPTSASERSVDDGAMG